MDLFENNDGWIVTKNEKGITKFAACSNDSVDCDKTRDWVIEEAEKTRTDTFKPPLPLRKKIVSLFISDLLLSALKDGMFRFRDFFYTEVLLCGTIVSLSSRDKSYFIKVDDGTCAVMCLLNKDNFSSWKKSLRCISMGDLPNSTKNDDFRTAQLMLIGSNRRFLNKIPDFNDLKLGDIIKIIGTVKDYNGNRYVFINKIIKEPEGTFAHQLHIEDLLYLYREVY